MPSPQSEYRLGTLIFTPATACIHARKQTAQLTPLGTKILRALFEAGDQHLDQVALYKLVWEIGSTREACAHKVDNQINRLRSAFEKIGESRELIQNTHGSGYWLDRLVGRTEDRQSQTDSRLRPEVEFLKETEPEPSWDRDELLIYEGHKPSEFYPEYRKTVMTRLSRGVRTVFVLGPNDAFVAATLLTGVIDDWYREHPGKLRIAKNSNLRSLLSHLWIVLSSRVSPVPLYVVHAQDARQAACYVCGPQSGTFLVSKGEAALVTALEACKALPISQQSLRTAVEHPVVFVDDHIGPDVRSELVQLFLDQSSRMPWGDENGELSDELIAEIGQFVLND